MDVATCIPELVKCVEEYGNVAINLNPDPSGGHWTSPPLSDRYWYPIYEKLTRVRHPGDGPRQLSCNACFHTTGAHYLNADTTAFMQCLTSDLFRDFPTLRFVIPHGGGAVPYHWGRFRGLAQEMKKPLLEEHLLNNIFFDTCVYHQPGIDLLTNVIPIDKHLSVRQRNDPARCAASILKRATTSTIRSATSKAAAMNPEQRHPDSRRSATRGASIRALMPHSKHKDDVEHYELGAILSQYRACGQPRHADGLALSAGATIHDAHGTGKSDEAVHAPDL